MSEHFYSSGIVRCRRRRTWGGSKTILLVIVLALIAAVVLSGCHVEEAKHGQLYLVPNAKTPGQFAENRRVAWEFARMAFPALFIAVSAVSILLAVRKTRENDRFYASLREEDLESDDWLRVFEERQSVFPRTEDEDVFAPLREPGGRIADEDAHMILVACASEGRNIMKRLRRAQETLSVEDYGDELVLAERELEVVVRCVEALAGRFNTEAES